MSPSVIDINVNLSDLMTPKSCSVLICELIKHLVYEREQIPYSFERLKYLITKRKELISKSVPDEIQQSVSLQAQIAVERHYSKAEETFLNLDSAFKTLDLVLAELKNDLISELVVVFGTTLIHPQNLFRILIPPLAIGHSEKNHPSRSHLPTLYQAIISSKELSKVLNKKISPTNVFILMKTKENLIPQNEAFYQKDHYKISDRVTHVIFNLKPSINSERHHKNSCSCNQSDFSVFCDTPLRHKNEIGIPTNFGNVEAPSLNSGSELVKNNLNEDDGDIEDSEHIWFQFSKSIKGFKDCKINGTSVANLWVKCLRPCNLTS